MTLRPTRVNLSDEVRGDSVDMLNEALADTLFAQLAVRAALWNARGAGATNAKTFMALSYKAYLDASERLAQRIIALGGTVNGQATDAMGSDLNYNVTDDSLKSHTMASLDLLGQIASMYRQHMTGSMEDEVTQSIFLQLTSEADQLIGKSEAELN